MFPLGTRHNTGKRPYHDITADPSRFIFKMIITQYMYRTKKRDARTFWNEFEKRETLTLVVKKRARK